MKNPHLNSINKFNKQSLLVKKKKIKNPSYKIFIQEKL